jgi:hypothetical protein
MGAASSREYAILAIERLFFAAGSRSHEKLMKGKANNDDNQKSRSNYLCGGS